MSSRDLLIRLRCRRALFGPHLLLLAAGVVPHHHADHDGRVLHLDEAHGSHGTVQALDVLRAPAVGPTTVPVAITQSTAVPALQLSAVHVISVAIDPRPLFGLDPPGALGSRAPPLLSL